MKKVNVKKYLHMSPFEVKNELIALANQHALEENKKGKKKKVLNTVLNAGRGNPNFLNTTVRQAIGYFHLFAAHQAAKLSKRKDIGLRPERKNIKADLLKFLHTLPKNAGSKFLKESIEFAIKTYKFDEDLFLFEMIDATVGDFYPMPSRILPHVEIITRKYIEKILCYDHQLPKGKFDLFATEGATAAMIYIFRSLKRNQLLKARDHIAIISPIFSPYLEIPHLKEYNLVEILVKGDEKLDWQIPDEELKKLEDKSVKALYLVNPTNPTSVALHKHTIKKIANLIKTKRKDLIIITDTVYSTFVDEFDSLIKYIPENTLCVYSYSKYFGVTGWRLGAIMLRENNIMDKKIAKLPAKDKKMLRDCYSTVDVDPDHIKFIDRLMIDSREPALAHTSGLSCPQQAAMVFFSLFELMDKKQIYKKAIHKILTERIRDLYKYLKMPAPAKKGHTYYYTMLNILEMAEKKHGKAFAKHLKDHIQPLEFLFRLAGDYGVVCLPGEGFAGPKWSLRVSLANLPFECYSQIGSHISSLIKDFYSEFSRNKRKKR